MCEKADIDAPRMREILRRRSSTVSSAIVKVLSRGNVPRRNARPYMLAMDVSLEYFSTSHYACGRGRGA